MGNVNLVEPSPERKDLARLDFDIRGLPLRAAERLVNHHLGVGQRETLALGACAQQEGAHRRGLAG
mgnify:CR=1 FL=1